MQDYDKLLIEKIRHCISAYGQEQFTLTRIAGDLGMPLDELINTFTYEQSVVSAMLN